MQCPYCGSTEIRKNGKRRGKQNHICTKCDRQFIDVYDPPKGYSEEIKQECLKMYLNGMGFRRIERVKGVHHTTIIFGVKQLGEKLADVPEESVIPEVGELDELETFIGSKKTKFWLWTAVNHFTKGILAWVLGDHSAETFEPLWEIVGQWKSYFYVTDGWKVYPNFIPDGDQIVSKTYMTRVENENTRLRHYLARLHRKTLCYSKSEPMLRYSIKLLLHYLKYQIVPT
ncbi:MULTISPECIES: IS1 family transposase [Nostoc]|uniref:IS1 family transposase n=2 Tax=Nostoc TaxID=1177 RepID=A0ABR8IKQ4_9NOSO|nr:MULTISPECIES: IS1 family transposase [Nostoc]MBD2566150.1 IS1 family transposase [Nostoc linckia FACHB-391]MBD2651749.1 IS1 family transposase [Nostoc foliaceum FACHB-393]